MTALNCTRFTKVKPLRMRELNKCLLRVYFLGLAIKPNFNSLKKKKMMSLKKYFYP